MNDTSSTGWRCSAPCLTLAHCVLCAVTVLQMCCSNAFDALHAQVQAGRCGPADSAADIHDSGAALDVSAPAQLPQRESDPQASHAQADAVSRAEPAQQPTSVAAVPPPATDEELPERSPAADAPPEPEQEISPAQGAIFSEVSR